MAENTREIDAPASTVWAVLSDGWCYGHWVVGTSHIRAVDPNWPALGSRLHYTVGVGPLKHEGTTIVRGVDSEHKLDLEIHAWPVGTVDVELELHEVGERCRVTMREEPGRGLAARMHNPLGDRLLKLRNVETLRRLARLAREHRDRRQPA